jgi:hypothetical protein
MLAEEITAMEVEDAINEAQEASAPGPSGQTITLYKILNQELPGIFTEAINQLVFNDELARHPSIQWTNIEKSYIFQKSPTPLHREITGPSAC